LLEQRARFTPEASALHLTRREDLLEISLAPPDELIVRFCRKYAKIKE